MHRFTLSGVQHNHNLSGSLSYVQNYYVEILVISLSTLIHDRGYAYLDDPVYSLPGHLDISCNNLHHVHGQLASSPNIITIKCV